MNSPKSRTFFSWHDGQNHRPSCHGVARRAKTDARERQEHGLLAVFAVDAGETLGEVTAVEVLVDHILDHRLEEDFSITGDNVVIDSVKKAEDDSGIIVRMYEAHGARGSRTFSTSLPVERIVETDLMEREEREWKHRKGKLSLRFAPFQIRTLKINVVDTPNQKRSSV